MASKANALKGLNPFKNPCFILVFSILIGILQANDTSFLNSTENITRPEMNKYSLKFRSATPIDFNDDNLLDLILNFGDEIYVVFGKDNNNQIIEMNPDSSNFTTDQGILIYKSAGYPNFAEVLIEDINGDEIDDIVLKDSEQRENNVFVVYGSKSLNSNIDLASRNFSPNQGFKIFDSNSGISSSFGIAVSCGDINGDNLIDIIIGDQTANSSGAAYVIYGNNTRISDVDVSSASFNPNQGFKISTSNREDYSLMGTAVSYAGDVNGDNIGDIMIGAYGLNISSITGVAYVIYGTNDPVADIDVSSSNFDSSKGFTIVDSSTNLEGYAFGSFLRNAGDINGDNIEDLLVGKFGVNDFRDSVYVVYGVGGNQPTEIDVGSVSFSSSQGFKITDTEYDPNIFEKNIGVSVRSVDVNGDNLNDLIIGAPRRVADGHIYVIFGSNTPIEDVDLAFEDYKADWGFDIKSFTENISVNLTGDFNGDGLPDFQIINNGDASGAAYVIYESNFANLLLCSFYFMLISFMTILFL